MAQGEARVLELAAEFGVTAKDTLVLLGGWNKFVKSANSTVEAPLARRVGEHYVARPPRLPSVLATPAHRLDPAVRPEQTTMGSERRWRRLVERHR